MFPRFFPSPSGFRVSTQVLFHWFDVASSQSSRFRSPHDNFYPPPACSSGLTWLYVLHWCRWTAVHLMNVIILFCHMDDMSMRNIQEGFLGREEEDRGQVVCFAQACEVRGWRWCSCVRFVLVGASFLGAFFHFLRSWRILHLIEGFYLNFSGGDLVQIRLFLWCKQQSPPGDPAPPRLVETLVTEGCRRKLKYDFFPFGEVQLWLIHSFGALVFRCGLGFRVEMVESKDVIECTNTCVLWRRCGSAGWCYN